MTNIGKLWAGKLYGTNTGNLFAEFISADGQFSGTLRVSDDRFGIAVYAVTGTFDGVEVQIEGKPATAPDNLNTGEISAKGSLTPEGHIRAQWSSTIGNGGTFILLPHDSSNPQHIAFSQEQLHTASRRIGALRLYAEDVQELIGFMSRDFSQGRVILTYRERGHEVSRYASDVQNELSRLGELRYLKLYIQAPDANGVNKFALVELNADGINEVRVQGIQESWVVGNVETITSFLKTYQKTLSTTFRSFGLNINGFLAIGTLVFLPELILSRRIIFVLAMASMGWAILFIHKQFIPNVIVYLSPQRPSAFQRVWPQILSWMIAATSAVFASVIYGILKGDYLPAWLTKLVG